MVKRFLVGEGLRARTIRSTFMTGLNFGGQNALRLAGNLVLTRILFPEAFGLMAIVAVVKTGVSMFADLGIRASIIQDSRGEDQVFLNTAWTLQVMRGIVLWLAICAVSIPIANFYELPELKELLPVAGLTALFQGFNSTKLATANKALRLGRVTVMSLSCQAVGLLATILLSLWLESVWGLVLGGLVAPLLISVLSHVVLPGPVNRFALERDALRRLIGFGKYIFLATIAGFVISQGDRAILGKIVTLDELAFYNIAYFLASVPLLLMRKLADNIVFPLYKIAPPRDSAANRAKTDRANALLVGAIISMTAILALFGNDLIRVLYDSRYAAAGPLLILLALAQIPSLIALKYSMLPLAAGNSRRFAIMTTLSASLRTLSLFIGAVHFGLIGVVLAPIFSALLYYVPMVWLTRDYRAWNPRLDAVTLLIGVILAAMSFWLNPEAAALITGLFTDRGTPG